MTRGVRYALVSAGLVVRMARLDGLGGGGARRARRARAHRADGSRGARVSTTDVPTVRRKHAAETMRRARAFYAYASACVARADAARRRPVARCSGCFGRAGVSSCPPATRAIVAANQAQVLGRPADDPLVVASTREAFLFYGAVLGTTRSAQLRWRTRRSCRGFDWDGEQYLLEPQSRGQGVIAVLPHLGNWDAAAADDEPSGCRRGGRRGAAPASVSISSSSGSGRPIGVRVSVSAMPVSARSSRPRSPRTELLALLADRDLSGRGSRSRCSARTRRMPAGPGAALAVHRRPDRRGPAAIRPTWAGIAIRVRWRSNPPGTGEPTRARSPSSMARASRRRSPRRRPTGTCSSPAGRAVMRVALACPYAWDDPGGVQVHVRELAEQLQRRAVTRCSCSPRRERPVPSRG